MNHIFESIYHKNKPSKDFRIRSHNDQKSLDSRLLHGRLGSGTMPAVQSSVVRVFISSTFSDFKCERNELMDKVYPRLKTFCKKLGLEFQALDMRWGVPEEAQNDHMTSDLCIKEIQKCHRISIGPSCVVMCGQKYGYRPFPSSIPVREFELIRSGLEKTREDAVALLDKWFKQDDNYVPARYVLQPITSYIPDYAAKESFTRRSAAQAEWNQTFSDLQEALRLGALEASLDRHNLHNYMISVTEDEAQHGILDMPPNKIRQPCFFRHIRDLESNLHSAASRKFIDLKSTGSDSNGNVTVDEEAQRLLRNMRNRILKTVDKQYTEAFDVEWSDKDGINETDHREYLTNFGNRFYDVMAKAIDYHHKKRESNIKTGLMLELHVHSATCVHRNKSFQGRVADVCILKNYLVGGTCRPFVVQGHYGSGKTSLMSHVAVNVHDWLKSDGARVVVRLIGLTPESSTIEGVLKSMCQQIIQAYDRSDTIPTELRDLSILFNKLLKVGNKSNPLIILLDSLEQLLSGYDTPPLSWIPKTLPEHCHFIISVSANVDRVCKRLEEIIDQRQCFLYLQDMTPSDSCKLLTLWLNQNNKTLTEKQMATVMSALRVCGLPLYTRLVYEEVTQWPSYLPNDQFVLQKTVNGIISTFFTNLETRHGTVLIQHALGYLTASLYGLSETEMEDILSLDDEVLNDVFSFWIPTTRRIPSLLWTRIHDSLYNYLVEREKDGCKVMCWYHNQFREAAVEYFLGDDVTRRKRHDLLADYFLGTWGGGKKKPFSYTIQQVNQMSLTQTDNLAADRKVPSQPLKWKDPNKGKFVVNLRKLRELPFHLKKSRRCDELKRLVLDFEWLSTMIKATSATDVLSVMCMLPKDMHCKQIVHIKKVLKCCGSQFTKLPNSLATELMGRRRDEDTTLPIIERCIDAEDHSHACKLLPAFQCFDVNEPPYQLLKKHNQPVVAVDFSDSGNRLCALSLDGSISYWDISNGDCTLVKEISIPKDCVGKINDKSELHFVTSETLRELLLVDCRGTKDSVLILDADAGRYLTRITHAFARHSIHRLIKTSQYIFKDGMIFDVDSGNKMANLASVHNLKERVQILLAFSDRYIIVGKKDAIVLVKISSNMEVTRTPCKCKPSKMALSKDNRTLVCGFNESNTVVCYRVTESRIAELFTCNFYDEFCDTSVISRATQRKIEKLLINGEAGQQTALVNVNGQFLFTINVHTGKAVSMCIPYDVRKGSGIVDCSFAGNNTVVALVNDVLCIWDHKTGTIKKTVHKIDHRLASNSFILSSKRSVATVTTDHDIKVWDVEQILTDTKQVSKYTSPVDRVTMIPGTNIACVRTRGTDHIGGHRANKQGGILERHFGLDIRCLSLNTRRTYLPDGLYGEMIDISFSDEGKVMVLLVEQTERTVAFVVDTQNTTVIGTISKPDQVRTKVSRNGRYIITEAGHKSLTGELQIWSVEPDLSEVHLTNVLQHCSKGMYTNSGAEVIFVAEKKKIGILQLETSEKFFTKSPFETITSVQTIPHRNDCVLITGCQHRLSPIFKHTSGCVWNWSTQKSVATLADMSPSGMASFSKDGHLAVDCHLQVYNLDTGKKIAKLQSHGYHRYDHVIMTYDGEYVIWADKNPAHCLRVAHVMSGTVATEAGTHSEIRSLVCADYGYTIACGCEDGNLIILKLHHLNHLDDQDKVRGSNISNLSWPPVTEDTIKKFDSVYRTASSQARNNVFQQFPSANTALQKQLTESFVRKSTSNLKMVVKFGLNASMPNIAKFNTLPAKSSPILFDTFDTKL